MRYYWRGKINFVVVNAEVDAAWSAHETDAPKFDTSLLGLSVRHRVQGAVLNLLQKINRGRRRQLDLQDLLRCPACMNEELVSKPEHVLCSKCNRMYPVRNGIPVMQVSAASVIS